MAIRTLPVSSGSVMPLLQLVSHRRSAFRHLMLTETRQVNTVGRLLKHLQMCQESSKLILNPSLVSSQCLGSHLLPNQKIVCSSSTHYYILFIPKLIRLFAAYTIQVPQTPLQTAPYYPQSYGFMVEGDYLCHFVIYREFSSKDLRPSYFVGSATVATGEGSDLIQESNHEVVVVIIQYRLGIFGVYGIV
jgi:hypothetical protein